MTTRQSLVPSANNPRLVTRLLEMVGQGVRSTRGLQEALGVEGRVVQQVAQAAGWLGLLDDEADPQLTPMGLEYVYSGRARSRVYARAVWQVPFVAELMHGRASLPDVAEVAAAVHRSEPDLTAANVQRRATALRSLIAPAIRGRRPDLADRQLDLPLSPRPIVIEAPKLKLDAGREYNPDVYRYLLSALLDHGELSLGQVRALLDRASVNEAPIGGYIDLALGRGDAARVEERIVLSREGAARRELAETTSSVVLSDPGYRTYLADARAAVQGDREAEIRRDRNRGRYRIWDRRLFGRDIDPKRIEVELRRVLMDRSLGSFPEAKGPGTAPRPVKEAFLDAWDRPELPIALPPSLGIVRGGLAAVNSALKAARQGAQDVALPDVAHRPTLVHGGLIHPGEPLPRTIPDLRTLRLRLLAHAPYVALTAALLLLHRGGGARLEVVQRRGSVRVRMAGEDMGELLELCDGFALQRGWIPCRRRQGGLGAPVLLEVLEVAGIAVPVGRRAVLTERFFVALRTEAEEMEVHEPLHALAQALEAWLEGVGTVEDAG